MPYSGWVGVYSETDQVIIKSVNKKPKDLSDLSVCEREECGHGDGGGVYSTLMENPVNLCVCDIEDRECGLGFGMNVTMMSETL